VTKTHSIAATPLPALPPLDSLKVAVLAARAGSFTAAADALGLTHGAVSRRVRSVESWLGTPLFERAGRGVTLTPAGLRLMRTAEQAIDAIARCAEQWRPHRGVQTVRLSVVPSFARLWVLPRLRALQGEPQDLRIELGIEHGLVDLPGGAVDLAVRYGRGTWPGVRSQLLLSERLQPVAAPALAQTLGSRAKPEALLRVPLIHDSDASQWRLWLAGGGHRFRPRSIDHRFEDYDVVLAAAEAGMGVALARLPLAQAWLDDGRLALVSPRAIANPLGHFIVQRPGEDREPVLRLHARLAALAGR
jgi:LysR family glycine cleavage system transcriptional activator